MSGDERCRSTRPERLRMGCSSAPIVESWVMRKSLAGSSSLQFSGAMSATGISPEAATLWTTNVEARPRSGWSAATVTPRWQDACRRRRRSSGCPHGSAPRGLEAARSLGGGPELVALGDLQLVASMERISRARCLGELADTARAQSCAPMSMTEPVRRLSASARGRFTDGGGRDCTRWTRTTRFAARRPGPAFSSAIELCLARVNGSAPAESHRYGRA